MQTSTAFFIGANMANRRKFYSYPDYKTVTTDIDEYLQAWRDVAAPVEEALGVKLTGFDPTFAFTRTDTQGPSVVLPVWFVTKLSEVLSQRRTQATIVKQPQDK